MFIDCPYCQRRLEYSKEPPRYCGYCGRPLGSTVDLQSASSIEVANAPTMLPKMPGQTHATTGDEDVTLIKPAEPGREFLFAADPERIGAYRLLRRLGGGGMGTVYEAQEPHSHRRVAIKLISPEFVSHTESLARFRQEGRLASRLAHPRCVFVYTVDEDAGRPYIVMELMPGKTLLDLVRENGPLSAEQAVEKILDVIDGLMEAHKLGLIHRDVKPSNCFLQRDGRVKVGDFGLSKSMPHAANLAQEDPSLTKTGAFVGTPLYAAPEQVKGDRVDQQADVYAVAATLHFLLTGKAPFEGSPDAMATMARIVSDDPPSVRLSRPEISTSLDQVILRGLSRDRKKRWKDMAAFRNALLPFLPKAASYVGLGLRVSAALIDLIVVFVMILLFEKGWQYGVGNITKADYQASEFTWEYWITCLNAFITTPVIMIIYFASLEHFVGCTLGKLLVRLRVHKSVSGENPTWGQVIVRSTVFVYALTLLEFILFCSMPYQAQLNPEPQSTNSTSNKTAAALKNKSQSVNEVATTDLLTFLHWPSWLVGMMLLSISMRASNGYRGLHEFCSDTRVVSLPWQWKPKKLMLSREHRPNLGITTDMPQRIGAFTIKGILSINGPNEIYIGQDDSLARPVWIWQRPRGFSLGKSLTSVDRAGRWRWLANGTEKDKEWDAWLATPGTFLRDIIAQGGALSWQEARHLLHKLAEELHASCLNQTLPFVLSTSQVWVQPDGNVQILDFPMEIQSVDSSAQLPVGDEPRSHYFLQQVAILCLEGQPRAVNTRKKIRVALPVHADRIVNRLLGYAQPALSLAQLLKELQETATMATEVTRMRRMGHFLLHGFSLLVLLIIIVGILTPLYMKYNVGKLKILSLNNQIEYLVFFLCVILISFLTRGGITYHLFGLALWNRFGGKVKRNQAALRTIIVSMPLLILFMIDNHLQTFNEDRTLFIIRLINSGLILVYICVHIVFLLIKPSESWHDRIVGTVIVPK